MSRRAMLLRQHMHAPDCGAGPRVLCPFGVWPAWCFVRTVNVPGVRLAYFARWRRGARRGRP